MSDTHLVMLHEANSLQIRMIKTGEILRTLVFPKGIAFFARMGSAQLLVSLENGNIQIWEGC